VIVGGEGVADVRHAELGARQITASAAPGQAPYYQIRRFVLGIADSMEIGCGKLFPHEANFDLMGAVDFHKGCYIGQEVVSRMHHRATTRSRILPLIFINDQFTDDHRVVEVLGRSDNLGLGLVRLDRLAEQGAPAGLTIAKPDWMKL